MSRTYMLVLTAAAAVVTACATPTEPPKTRQTVPSAPAADSIPDSNCFSGYSVGHGICG